jgi:hypothetical protein
MKKHFILLLLAGVLFCCEKKSEPGPDLAGQFVGKFDVRYTVLKNPGGQKLTESQGISNNGFVEYQKKNNNTLLVKISIKDALVDIHDEFEATITEDRDQTDMILKEGYQQIKKYRITYNYAAGSTSSQLIKYKNDLTSGNISYTKDDLFVSAGFPW